jgi:hypothetical protein
MKNMQTEGISSRVLRRIFGLKRGTGRKEISVMSFVIRRNASPYHTGMKHTGKSEMD